VSVSQRTKGQRGERELFALLSGELGSVVRRRVDSSRDGGCDSLDIDGWAIECKRAERFLFSFWYQAVAQAEAVKRRPVLFWRKSRQPSWGAEFWKGWATVV
jgi:hypothetical protein